MKRHVPAVAPTPNPDAVAINKREPPQISHSVSLVRKLVDAGIVIERSRKSMPTPHGPVIVDRKNNKSLLRQHLIEKKIPTEPRIANYLRRPAIGIDDHRIFPGSVEIGRLDH